MKPTRVGLVSDTHGLLRPEAIDFLRGSDFIIHGGDIGSDDLLRELDALAPITAVRGNNDRDRWADHIPYTQVLTAGDVLIYVLHDVSELDIDPAAAGYRVVVSGHSHRPSIAERDGVLYVNPGSAGPRRFTLPISAGELVITGRSVAPRLVELTCAEGRARRASRRRAG